MNFFFLIVEALLYYFLMFYLFIYLYFIIKKHGWGKFKFTSVFNLFSDREVFFNCLFYTLCIFVYIFVILLTVILNIQQVYAMESDAVSTIEYTKDMIDYWQNDWENLKDDLINPDKWDFPEFSP